MVENDDEDGEDVATLNNDRVVVDGINAADNDAGNRIATTRRMRTIIVMCCSRRGEARF